MSFENSSREDVDTALGGNDSNSFNIHFSDFRMLDTATGNFDPVDCEALDQTIPPFNAANALRPSQPGRSDSDVAPNQPLIADVSGFDLDAPVELGESGVETCPWPACSTGLPTNEVNRHLGNHWSKTKAQWIGASKCPWPKCSSRATFKSTGSLKAHLFNIHVTPLVCEYPLCTYTKPFGRQFDLDRHILTAHGDARDHKCPIESCPSSVTGFARKDKLVKHLKEEHENVRCPYNHCFAAVPESQEETHVQQSHGEYECGIGGCENGRVSRFMLAELKQHLRRDHGINYDPTCGLRYRLERLGEKTLKPHTLHVRKMWLNCATCSLSDAPKS